MTLQNQVQWPKGEYPDSVFWDINASFWMPFLCIKTEKSKRYFVKTNHQTIIERSGCPNIEEKEFGTNFKGGIFLLDEFEKKGGDEDLLWR